MHNLRDICTPPPPVRYIYAHLVRNIVDLGPASLYLGICIIQDHSQRKLWLSQKSFIADLLSTWNITECQTSPVPLQNKLHQLCPIALEATSDIPDHLHTQKYQSFI